MRDAARRIYISISVMCALTTAACAAPLKDEDGDLRAEYTIEGMHINEDGYRSIYPLIRKYILE